MNKTITQESSVDYLRNELELNENKNDFILAFWLYWAESVTTTNREFAQVLANAPVNRWFLMELAKEEKEFRFMATSYSEMAGQGKEIDLLYIKCINKLMSRFPKSLLDQAKKREQKPQKIKVAGIRTEISILNQN